MEERRRQVLEKRKKQAMEKRLAGEPSDRLYCWAFAVGNGKEMSDMAWGFSKFFKTGWGFKTRV